MRFCSFASDGVLGIAAENQGVWRGLTEDAQDFPGELGDLVKTGADLAALGRRLAAAPEIDLSAVDLRPPVARPGKIICIGLNYIDHSTEIGFEKPAYPTVFARYSTSLTGAGAALRHPKVSRQFDYEGEAAVIIGKGGRDIARADALSHVLGYSLFNDASVRDYQFKSPQWTVGKNFDATGAFGPWLVTADELPPGAKGLTLTTRLNGVVVQQASTDDMIFDVAELIALLSEAMTLEPGDVIVSGTPAGVGMARKPPLFMKVGDVCEVEVEGIGLLRNTVG
jgi:acylpyruvate hydrolase